MRDSSLRIIGIGGTNGAGKDAAAELLVSKHGYLFASATEMFVIELKKRGWPTDREHKAKLSAEWRREFGMSVVVDRALDMLAAAPAGKYRGLVVASLRHPAEAERIHELGGTMLWVDADPEVRYRRIRGANRGRGAEDDKTYEEFLADERREMTPIGDAATLNMTAVKAQCDITLMNNFSDLSQLATQLDTLIARGA